MWAGQVADEREISVFTVAASGDPVTCSHGLRVIPITWSEAPPLDVLLFPGGRVDQFSRYAAELS